MTQVTMEPCYVCNELVNLDADKFCTKEFAGLESADDSVKYRHLWHGAPGITRAVGGGGGFNGYAMTLHDAKQRAEYYVNENPYAAPEVIAIELEILEEIERMERVSSIVGFMERNVAAAINVDYLH